MLVQESLTLVETCKLYTFIGVLIFLAIILFACLIRAIMGPRVADRVIAVNMMGTVVMVMISILALLLKEGYLMDICLIYACISFLAVVVITKVYLGVFAERMIEEEEKHGDVLICTWKCLPSYRNGRICNRSIRHFPPKLRTEPSALGSTRRYLRYQLMHDRPHDNGGIHLHDPQDGAGYSVLLDGLARILTPACESRDNYLR